MKLEFLVGPGATTSKTDSPVVLAMENPLETCIARTTFRKLPTDIQLEYAQHHKLSGAETLTPEEICTALFRESDWMSALEIEGHIRLPTASGVVVAKDVIDLVDWLVEEQTDGTSLGNKRLHIPEDTYLGTQDKGEDDTAEEDHIILRHDVQDDLERVVERLLPVNFHRMADELERVYARVKTAVEDSQRVIRDAVVDISIFQGQLAEANSYHAEVMKTVTNIVGMDVMQGIMEQVDRATLEGKLSSNLHQDTTQMETAQRRMSTRKAANRTQKAVSASYHAIASVERSLDGHLVAGPSNRRLDEDTRLSSSRTRRVHLKRTRGNGNDSEEVETESSSTSSHLYGFPHRHKKPRLGERSQPGNTLPVANEFSVVQTILNYPSDDDNSADSTYLDSSGTERDFIDDPYSFLDFRGNRPDHDLLARARSRSSCSSEEDSYPDSDHYNQWGITEDEDCYSDPDYKPPDWDLEDIFELKEVPGTSRVHPLFKYKYIDELLDCGGVVSDSGVSTDDSDRGYLTQEMLQRPFDRRRYPESLGPLKYPPFWEQYRYNGLEMHDEERFLRIKHSLIAQRKNSNWGTVKSCLKHQPGFVELNVDQRLDDILASDHSHYWFDNVEWMYFVEPLPGVSFKT